MLNFRKKNTTGYFKNIQKKDCYGVLLASGFLRNNHFSKPNKSTLAIAICFAVLLLGTHIKTWSQSTQTYNSSGTFTVPAGVTSVTVECWGGGGSGGGTTANRARGGGGGAGGAYARSILTVTPGTGYTVTVGGTRTGTNGAGQTGNPSWFGTTSTVYAQGGAGGAAPNRGTVAGGTGSSDSSIGDVVHAGGDGANGTSALGGAGGGGAGSDGDGGDASGTTAGSGTTVGGGNGGAGRTTENNGLPGSTCGGGGGGAYLPDNSDHSGGNGAAGRVSVTYTCPTYSLTGISATDACSVAGYRTSTVTLSSSAAGLPLGDYTVTYSRTNPNATGLTATFSVSVAGTGQFTATGFTNNGTSTITVTNLTSSYCSSAISSGNSTSITVSGSVPAQPSAITGSTTPCNGSSETYSVSNVSGVSYSWSLPSDWVQTGGGNTNSITVTVGNEIGDIVVTPSNGCGDGTSRSLTITQTGPELITSPGSQCLYGATVDVTVSANSSSTGTFRWYDSSYTLLETESSVSESSYDANGISTNTTYYVTFESGGCTTPYTEVIAYAIEPPTLDASAGGSFCVGSTIYLYSEGTYDNIYWEGPDDFYSIEEDPEITSATTDMNGTYTVHTNTLSGVNLVVNGDFEDGNVGFSSSYTFHDTTEVVLGCYANAPLGCEGTYTVVRSPRSVHPNFYRCGDHTTGQGMQMVINGASTTGVVIWSQTVNVVPNTYYQFSYWVQTVELSYVSQLQLYVNGELAGPVYTASESTCEWTQFFYSWDSDDNTTAELSLINQRTAIGGNDFALDDIIFQHTCTASASVEVNVSNSFTPLVSIAASPSNTICAGEEVTFTATPTHGGATPSYQWRLNSNNVGSNSPTYTNSSLANGDQISCIMTSSLTTCLAPGSNPATSNTVTMTVNPLPVITPGTDPNGCIGNTTVNLTYSNPQNSPDEYSIEWGALALSEDFLNVTGQALGASPIPITVPIDAPANTYPATLYVVNSSTGCTSAAIPFNVIMDICFSITDQPDNEEVCAAENAQFSVTSDATSPTYQWQENQGSGWNDLSGEESSTLTLNAVTNGMNGYQYRCQVTEGGITLDSDPATLTVNTLPDNSFTLEDPEVCYGASAIIGISDSEMGISYQLRLNSDNTPVEAPIVGAGSEFDFVVEPGPTANIVYNVLATNTTTNCSAQLTDLANVTVLVPEVVVTLIESPKCPDLDPDLDFEPNTTSYNAGGTTITFRVTRNSPVASNWSFDFELTLSTSSLRIDSPRGLTGSVVMNPGDNQIDLVFYVVNIPGTAINAEIALDNVSAGGCTEASTANHTKEQVISSMPEIGDFD